MAALQEDMHFVLAIASDKVITRKELQAILVQVANELNDRSQNEGPIELDSVIIGKWRLKENG